MELRLYSVTAELDENNMEEIFEKYESDYSFDYTSGKDDTSLSSWFTA